MKKNEYKKRFGHKKHRSVAVRGRAPDAPPPPGSARDISLSGLDFCSLKCVARINNKSKGNRHINVTN